MQLAEGENKAAETTFRTALTVDPGASEAHLGLIRALVAQGKVSEAQTEAAAFLAAKPKDAAAEVAAAEVAFRLGDIDAAVADTRAALADNPCEGRAAGAMASMLELSGYRATMARYLNQGHRLRPNDEAMRRYWMANLPRQQHLAELSAYLSGPNHLSKAALLNFGTRKAMLEAYRPGECAVTLPGSTVTLPLQPVMGERSQVTGFTLEMRFGNKTRRLGVTTSGSGITLSGSTARALGLQPEYQLAAGPAQNGKSDGYLAHVPELRAGELKASNCLVRVSSQIPFGWDGVIGMEAFRQWLVTLDYSREEFHLDPLPARPGSATDGSATMALDDLTGNVDPGDRFLAPEMKDWSTLFRNDGITLVPAHIANSSHKRYLLLEDASQWTALSPAAAKEGGALHESSLRTVFGPVDKISEVDHLALSLGNLNLQPTTYYVFDMTHSSDMADFEVSGLLGLPTLQHLTLRLDFRDNLFKMVFDPNQKLLRF